MNLSRCLAEFLVDGGGVGKRGRGGSRAVNKGGERLNNRGV
jgi:hypothetical protein